MRNGKKKQNNNKSSTKMVSQLERVEKHDLLRLQPPSWEPLPILSGSARFKANSALAAQTMNIKDILILPGILCTTSVLGYPICIAARLRKIRVWGFVATAGTPVTVSIQKAGIDSSGNDFNDPFRKIQDSSNSFDRPAFIEMNFDKFSPSGSFHTTENINGNICFISAPAGAIIDCFYNYVLNLGNAVSATTYVLGAGAAGQIGRIAILGAQCDPIAVNNIT